MHESRPAESLDPRRRPRNARRRDWASMSRTVTIPRMHELLARVLVRLGLAR